MFFARQCLIHADIFDLVDVDWRASPSSSRAAKCKPFFASGLSFAGAVSSSQSAFSRRMMGFAGEPSKV